MIFEYPFDIKTLFSKSRGEQRTFSVEARFTPRPDEEDSPLKIFDNSFSRFVLTVINDGKTASANFGIEKLACLKAKTRYVYEQYLNNSYACTSISNGSMSNVTFKCGSLKGKTPSDVLRENGDNGTEILKKQRNWLSQNLSAHPENKEVIDAIDCVLSGNVSETTSGDNGISMPVITLAETPAPIVLKRRKNKAGNKSLVYEYHIQWNTDPSRNSPVSIQIRQFYAPYKETQLPVPVLKDDKGNSLVEDDRKCYFNLTAEQWLDIVDSMEKAHAAFYNMQFTEAYITACEAEKQNRTAAAEEQRTEPDVEEVKSGNATYPVYELTINSKLEQIGPDAHNNPNYASTAIDSEGNTRKVVYMYGIYCNVEHFEQFRELCGKIGNGKEKVTTKIFAETCEYNGEKQLRFRGFSK